MSPVDKKSDKPRYWRSLAEYENSPEFREFVEHEFAAPMEELPPASPERRRFMQLMGASFALAGVSGCRWQEDRLLPHARRPEGLVPGETKQYATAMDIGGVATGLLVRSYEGRPIKVEGNPSHPDSRGACNVFHQASVLEFYDPDRSKEVVQYSGGARQPSSWEELKKFAKPHFQALKNKGGQGLRVLSDVSSSPSLADMKKRVSAAFPQARWYEYEPISDENARAGSRLAFDAVYRPVLSLEKATVILSLDGDFLGSERQALRASRGFAEGRRPETGSMSRLYVLESGLSVTGGMADHRLAVRSEHIKAIACALDAAISGKVAVPAEAGPAQARPQAKVLDDPRVAKLLSVVEKELLESRGKCVIVAGEHQPPEVHALVHRLNVLLGNVGRTVSYVPDASTRIEGDREAIQALVAEMNEGKVDTLVIIGGNPAHTAPADVQFASALGKVKHSIRVGLYEDETSRLATWHLPQAHYLEAWGDARALDGTISIVQPLIAPLYEGKSAIEVLALLLDDSTQDGMQIVKRTLSRFVGDERLWRKAVHDGVVFGSALTAVEPALRPLAAVQLSERELGGLDVANGKLEVVFTADSKLYDGRYANNGWLQELPDTITKLTWDNAVLMSPSTGQALGVQESTLVSLALGGRSVTLPVLFVPGQAPGSVRVALGYGRTASGVVGLGGRLEHGLLADHEGDVEAGKLEPIGVNTYVLRTTESWSFGGGGSIEATGKKYKLATTQDTHAIDQMGREGIESRLPALVREASLEEYKKHPDFAKHRVHHPPLLSLWQEPVSYDGNKWGMSIDLNRCTGCNACVMACQAENNVPVVGKERVAMGREMHWIRVDRYFGGDPEDPSLLLQPLTCHQCEHAPCEQVCPVGATMHTHEGLNDMVYNRCIGTRYCSNNCPYKVRRFNYFNFHEDLKQPKNQVKTMVFNPEVTVRSRGVMEKCTFCVQRIQAVKIKAKNERRPIKDGEITPACAETCPTEAIVFGDLNDPKSRVAELQRRPRSYAMLAELNVRPRLEYLARVRNPNPELA